jgi:hypothetical protein
MAMNYAEAQ